MVSALSTFYQDSHDPFDEEQVHISTIRLLAKLPTIAAYAFKKSVGQALLYPDNSLDYVQNFLRMTFAVPSEEYKADPVIVSALDKLLILHADHEQNCSTIDGARCVGPPATRNLFAQSVFGHQRLWELAARRREPVGCWRCWTPSRRTAATSTRSCAR
ncbi:citrate/2-methylcitrate synthase [Yinghuangia aomiensis]